MANKQRRAKAWFIEYDDNGKRTKGFYVDSYCFEEKGKRRIAVEVPRDLNPTKAKYREIYLSVRLLKKQIKYLEKPIRRL